MIDTLTFLTANGDVVFISEEEEDMDFLSRRIAEQEMYDREEFAEILGIMSAKRSSI